jgi:tetratricopeptide (TPR) repeat protein
MSIAKLKRVFQKAFSSDRANFMIRKAKCEQAIDELRKAITYLEANNLAPPVLRTYKTALTRYEQALNTADRLAEKKPNDAFKSLETTKKQARISAKEAKTEVKRVPMAVTSTDGKTASKIYPNDVPGFSKMSDREREQTVKRIADKIGKGKDLFKQVQNNPKFLKQWAPTQEDVADVMWFLKNRAQESIGQAYERGAMTIPDEDGNMQALLDKCQEAYIRDSSHMRDQQKLEDGQARGIDFYEGMEDGNIADMDKLLPSGMRTVLYQKTTTAQGKKRLYVKMETESARIRAKFYTKDFYRNEIESRPREMKDWGRSILHLGNLIKAKCGVSQGEDKDLKGFREALPKAIGTHIKNALKAAKASEDEDAIDAIEGLQKAMKGGITQIWEHYLTMGEAGIPTDNATYEHLAKMAQAIFAIAPPDSNLDERLGEEVVLGMDDLLPPEDSGTTDTSDTSSGSEEDEEPEETPDSTDKAIALLSKQLQAVQGCQHTDDLEDLQKVLEQSQMAIVKVKSIDTVASNKAVDSAVKQLESALGPLERLIKNMVGTTLMKKKGVSGTGTLPGPAQPLVGNVNTANPMLYFIANNAGGVNLRVESANPGGGWAAVDQFCAYMATEWLVGGGGGGLNFSGLGNQQDAIQKVSSWASSGGLAAQEGYAAGKIGGAKAKKTDVVNKATANQYPVGTKIWFGTDQHAMGAVVTGDNAYKVYDPNNGGVQNTDGPGFAGIAGGSNAFVVK